MSALTRVSILKMGLHNSNVQWETDGSVSYNQLEPFGEPTPRVGKGKLENPSLRDDARHYADDAGVKETGLSVPLKLRGISGGAGDETAAGRLTKTEIGFILDSLMGAVGVDGTGAEVTGGTSSAPTVDETAGFAPGSAGLFSVGGVLYARQITARSETSGAGSLTLDRALPSAAANESVAYASASWALTKNANPIHLAADWETDAGYRYKMLGMMGGFTIALPPNGGTTPFNVELDGTHWTRETAGLTFSAPTVGGTIPAVNSPILFGTTEYDLFGAELSVEVTKQPREHYSSINGLTGYDVTDKVARLRGRLRAGSLTGEITPAVLDTLQATGTFDVLFQLGRTAGAAAAFRFPAFNIRAASLVPDNGRWAIDFEGFASRPASGSEFFFHLF